MTRQNFVPMIRKLLLMLLVVFPTQIRSQESPAPRAHPLTVNNGSGDGNYVVGETVPIAANPDPAGAKFIMWMSLSGSRNLIASRYSRETTVTMPSYAYEVVAVYARLKTWFPPGPETPPRGKNNIGLFLPANPSASPPDRYEMKIKVEMITGETEAVDIEKFWKQLAVDHDWFPTPVEGFWHSNHVEFYTEETGGTGIQRNQYLGKDRFTVEGDPKSRTATLWYEPKWKLEDLVPRTPKESPRPLPEMNVFNGLNLVKPPGRYGYNFIPVMGLGTYLLPVEIKEIWSNQIADVEVNGFPDKTGQKEYPYILIGATLGSTFKVKIKLASEIPATIQSKILFRWAVVGKSISPENGTSTFTDAKTVQLDSNASIGIDPRGLVMGFDENSDGQLDASETTGFLTTRHVRSGTSTIVQYKFIPIAQTRYNDSKSELLGWAATAPALGLREGARHLTAFCNGSVPTFAGSEPTTIKRNEPGLSHPVGVAFTPVSNPGDSFTAVISKDHDLSINLIESNALRSWMTGEFNSVAAAIKSDVIAARQNGNPAQLLSYSLPATEKSLGFGLSDPDLLVCLGRVTLKDPVIQFKVTMFGYVNDVKILGTAHDLYDFDYGGEEILGYPARRASELQAGFPSLGTGGKVFKTQIDLGGGNPYANPDLTPYTFFPY